MSAHKIAKLEALLARIQSRSRVSGAVAASVRHSSESAPELEVVDEEVEVEVSSEVVEVDIDVEPLESGAQAVSIQSVPPDELDDEYSEDATLMQATQHAAVEEPVAELEEVHDEEPQEEEILVAANEVVEPAPSSSRRPIAMDQSAYEGEAAPRHTPPPESGKQVASAHPPRMSSVPPSEQEGHTLIGGWREPGLPGVGKPFIGIPSGVRVPAPPPESPAPPSIPRPQTPVAAAPPVPASPAHVSPPAPPVSAQRLSPDVAKPNLPATANVASFQGAIPTAKPATFGDLVDWTLSL
mgnify:CR=1 FL=1